LHKLKTAPKFTCLEWKLTYICKMEARFKLYTYLSFQGFTHSPYQKKTHLGLDCNVRNQRERKQRNTTFLLLEDERNWCDRSLWSYYIYRGSSRSYKDIHSFSPFTLHINTKFRKTYKYTHFIYLSSHKICNWHMIWGWGHGFSWTISDIKSKSLRLRQ
jgi:hypothetical protein